MARRLPQLSRGSTALVLNALLAVAALGLAFAPAGQGAPKLRLAGAAGSLSLSNSKVNAAIFRADGMRPGQQASGSVTITNTGTVTGALTLMPAAPEDTPGPGGGRLSSRLELLVMDVTTNAPVTLYTGTLEQMGRIAVGSLAPGERRSFQFAGTLHPGGASDNLYQGATLTTGFVWSATGAETATPAPTSTPLATPAPTATPFPSPPPAVPGAAADPTGELLGAQLFGLPAAKKCVSRRKFTIHIRRPAGTVFRSVAVTVNGRTKLRLKGLRAKKVRSRVSLKGLPAGKVKVKITAVTTTGRKAVSKRTYKTCATRKR